jgi:hypothetical protein
MKPGKVVREPFGQTTRYKCTCGHSEERSETRAQGAGDLEFAAVEGFEELL